MEEEEILTNPLENLLDEDKQESPGKDNTQPKKETQVEDGDDPDDKSDEEPKLTAKEIRHAQQQEWAKMEVERLRNLMIDSEVKLASQDATSLLELAKKDAKLADEVAKRFWYDDFKDAKKQITAGSEVEKKVSTKPTEEQFEEWYQQRKSKEEHNAAIDEVAKLIEQLPEDVQEQAKEDFNELMWDKILTREKALKFAKMVTLSLTKEEKKPVDTKEALKKLSTTWVWKTKQPSKDEAQEIVVDGKVILLNSNQTK